VRRRSGSRRWSRAWRWWRHGCQVRRRRRALPRPRRRWLWCRRKSGWSCRRGRRGASAQPCYRYSVVRTPCVGGDVANYHQQRFSRGNFNLEGLIRVRAGTCVSNPVGADVIRIEAPQISSHEDRAEARARCVGIDRGTLRGVACAGERVRIVKMQ
jgi:hypothetical protein